MSRKTLGVLECGRPPQEIIDNHGDYAQQFVNLVGDDFDYRIYAVLEGEFPQDISECDGYLITGSKHGVYSGEPWITPLMALIRDIYAADIPQFGICFGHQVMAHALGGRAEKFDGGWGMGPTNYTRDDGSTITINAFHEDQVVAVPADKFDRVTASTPFCQYAGIAYKGKAASIQPHPEFSAEMQKDLMVLRKPMDIDPAVYDSAMKAVEVGQSALDSEVLAQEIRDLMNA